VIALLDTHVLVWWIEGGKRLSRRQRQVISRASAAEPLLVSDITLWEVAMLHSHGRIKLGLPLRDWLEGAVAPEWVRRMGISPAIAADVTLLPAGAPNDPADRIILATARVLGATLLTRDSSMIDAEVVPTIE
jgi:PIN domain nuclease of toxin-antitoxin system